MKCDACGAPVENGVCTYCGKEFHEKPENKEPEEQKTVPEKEKPQKVVVNVINQAVPVAKEVAKKNSFWRTCGLVLLWIAFFPIMLSLYIWKSDKFSKKTKYILLALIWVITIILGFTANNSDSDTTTTTVSDSKPIYESAEIKDMMNGPGTQKIGEVSVIFANKEDITDEVLADWYFNYVAKNDYSFNCIIYNDTSPIQGVYGNKSQVQKDVTFEKDKDIYMLSSDRGSTFYMIKDNQTLEPYYTEPTTEEANQIITEIDGFITGDFKGNGYQVDVGGDKNKLDLEITLVNDSMDENTYQGATAYLAEKIKGSNLPIGYMNISYQTDEYSLKALGSVDDVSAYAGPSDVKVTPME